MVWKGKHRITASQADRGIKENAKNTDDPRTCGHGKRSKTKLSDERGGYIHWCRTCDSQWWTPE